MTEQAKIVSRIRKLLALAESDNLNEAEVAAKMATKLMKEHAISMSSLSEADLLERDPVGVKAVEVGKTTWAINLAWAMATHCNVSCLRFSMTTDRNPWRHGGMRADHNVREGETPRNWKDWKRRTYAVAWGHQSDLEVWAYLIEVATRQINDLTKLERERIKERDGYVTRTEATQYREGLVGGLGLRLKEQRRFDTPESTGTALVLQSRSDRAEQAMRSQHPKTSGYSGGCGMDAQGLKDGYTKINLNKAMTAQPGAKLLGGE